MHSALFVAVKPPSDSQDWHKFIHATNTNAKIKEHAERLAEGVWLVNFQRSPAALGLLICAAEPSIGYRILPLAEAPQWFPVADPN